MSGDFVKFVKPYNVTVYDVDHNGLVKLETIFNYFQEAATLHSIELGVSYFDLVKLNEYWVLTRMCVEIDKYPKYSERVEVVTYPIAPRSYDCERDYYLVNDKGEVLVRGISKWVILDANTKQLKKISEDRFPSKELLRPDRAIQSPQWKVNCGEAFEQVSQNYVGLNDIDFNMHMNNAKYIAAACNALTAEDLDGKVVSGITANFLKEMPLGQKYSIEKTKEPAGSTVVGFFRDGAASFMARMTFTDNFQKFEPHLYGF